MFGCYVGSFSRRLTNACFDGFVVIAKSKKVICLALLTLIMLPMILAPVSGTSDYEEQPIEYASTLPTILKHERISDVGSFPLDTGTVSEGGGFTCAGGVDEQFGPAVDIILFKLYDSVTSEFTALEDGEIDIADSALTESWIQRWTGNPEITMMDWGYGKKAFRTKYTGGNGGILVSPDDGENIYRDKLWKGIVNEFGFGVNSWGTFLNAHPEGYELPEEGYHMVMRYGLSVPEFEKLNPIYSTSYEEWQVLDKTYDTLIKLNAYDPSEALEWIAKPWEIGPWWAPWGEEATKVIFDLRDDVYWHDGVQLTSDDINFTFVELVKAIESRGLPYPTFYDNIVDVYNVVMETSYRVIIKLNRAMSKDSALTALGSVPILPKHIWEPIMEGPDLEIGTADDDTYNPTLFSPDPSIVGAGPFQVYPHSIHNETGDYYKPGPGFAVLNAYREYFNGNPDRKSVGFNKYTPDERALTITTYNYHKHDIEETMRVRIIDPVDGIVYIDTPYFAVTKPSATKYGDPPLKSQPGIYRVRFDVSFLTEGKIYTIRIDEYDVCMTEGTRWPRTGENTHIFSKKIPPVRSSITKIPGTDEYKWRQGDICGPGGTPKDGKVDIFDVWFIHVHHGGKSWVWTEGDVNEDGYIDVLDAIIVQRDMGP